MKSARGHFYWDTVYRSFYGFPISIFDKIGGTDGQTDALHVVQCCAPPKEDSIIVGLGLIGLYSCLTVIG